MKICTQKMFETGITRLSLLNQVGHVIKIIAIMLSVPAAMTATIIANGKSIASPGRLFVEFAIVPITGYGTVPFLAILFVAPIIDVLCWLLLFYGGFFLLRRFGSRLVERYRFRQGHRAA